MPSRIDVVQGSGDLAAGHVIKSMLLGSVCSMLVIVVLTVKIMGSGISSVVNVVCNVALLLSLVLFVVQWAAGTMKCRAVQNQAVDKIQKQFGLYGWISHVTNAMSVSIMLFVALVIN
jgi:hypothetical protein